MRGSWLVNWEGAGYVSPGMDVTYRTTTDREATPASSEERGGGETVRDGTQGNNAGLLMNSSAHVRVPCLARRVRDLPSEEQSFSLKLRDR